MQNKFVILIGLLVLPLIGCGKFQDKFSRLSGGETTIHFKSNRDGGFSPLALDGDMMIYLIRTDGGYSRSLHLVDESDAKTVTVPNGNYKIYASGWTGTANLTGTTKCARANGGNPITLGGGNVTVSLDLSQANCGFTTNTEFADSFHAISDMRMTELYFCTNFPPASGGCTTATSYSGSIKFVVYEYESINGQTNLNTSNSLTSACYSVSSGTVVAPGPRVLPGEMIVSGIEAYSDASCGTLARTYEFRSGLKNASSSPGVNVASITMNGDFEVYLYKNF